MKCPVCGWVDGYFHIAGHMLSYERSRSRRHGAQTGAGGQPVAFPTFRETAVMVGFAIETGMTRFNGEQLVVPG